MTSETKTFCAIDDQRLVERIDRATTRVVFAAPGAGRCVADALVRALARVKDHQGGSVTVILAPEEDVYQVGYGEPAGLETLGNAAVKQGFSLRRLDGLRIGILACDDDLLVWSPTPRSVEADRLVGQPNGIALTRLSGTSDGALLDLGDRLTGPTAENIGVTDLTREEVKKALQAVAANPPAPFDLSQKTRVFATRYQFVEHEVHGAAWTDRRIKLSSLLLNADLPEPLQEVIESQIRPFQAESDKAFPVPHFVQGRPAYEKSGEPMMVPARQSDLQKVWADICARYLHHVKGFGWLIRRDRLAAFRVDVDAFEIALRAWVAAFQEHADANEDRLAAEIVDSIEARLERSTRSGKIDVSKLKDEVLRGFQRLRVTKQRVRIVLKNVAWESSRDEEFMQVLRGALPKEDRDAWFEEFTAVRQAKRAGDAQQHEAQ